jgi:predicted Rossmann fold flavoprotein
MGVSVNNVKVKIPGTKLEQAGPLLITHWGLSGPVILRLSAWGARELAEKKYEFSVIVNWVPAYNEQSLRSFLQQQRHMAAGKKISAKNPFGLPQRLWDYLLHAADADSSLRWADLPARNQNSLVRHLCSHELLVRGKTTFKEEFVTAGGISLQEIDPEIMDVDGITGGYNFQHAWTSGFIAAKTIADRGRKVD